MKSNWHNSFTELKPSVDSTDKWNKEHGISKRVVVWLEGKESADFGRYNYETGRWTVEGCLGFDQEIVKWWQYITNPYK